MEDNKRLAELLFPDIKKTPEDYEKIYPKRNLPEGAMVTRFGPSPTGFVHIGSLMTSLICERFAHQTDGVFYLRIEDTDRKREVQGAIEDLIKALHEFGIDFDEGAKSLDEEVGDYGPYKQSNREEIYKTYIKYLIEKGLAYPCFCSPEDIEEMRNKQEKASERPGYYGKWAACRNLSYDEVEKRVKEGKTFTIRLKSPGNVENTFKFNDLVKGELTLHENDLDIVLLKTEGLPMYHFAHAIDDHLMRTTHVIRSDEWLPSAPLHVQLFQCLGFEVPRYAHGAPIMKEEGSSRRKLSKRKDPESAVLYFYEQGYPDISVEEYLLTLINSNFEEWRLENPRVPNSEFEISFEKMSTSGALFDFNKLADVSKNTIAYMNAEDVYALSIKWSKDFDKELADLMEKNEDYTKRVLNIERTGDRPRKDIAKWSELKDSIWYFYDEFFNKNDEKYDFPEKLSSEDVKNLIAEYIKEYDKDADKQTWFGALKDFAEKMGFAKDMKEFKKNPEAFKGNVADVAGTLRVALTKRKNTPDLHEMMQVMGYDKVIERLNKAVASL